jgi:hypothetical protein
MILSRAWYVVLGLAVAVALYVVYVAVGQQNRQGALALREGLASDSQTVEWALKIDARRRLDALLPGSVDATLQQTLVAADGAREKLPEKLRADARKSLMTIRDAVSADWRPDALFAVDRDGRVVGEVGYDSVASSEDFELGGYAAVNDALHGWLRDDVWILGGKMYVVSARPVEYDVAQRPAGAIVGLREVGRAFAEDLAKRTRTNVVFFAGPQVEASGVGGTFEAGKMDVVFADRRGMDEKAFGDTGRSDARMIGDDLGVLYARMPGDAWSLGGAFAVARSRGVLASPMGFLSGADDRDKANVPWPLLAGVALAAALIGILLTVLEHTLSLKELVMQADRLKTGAMDSLQVARFRGSYRLVAQSLNEGMERSIERAGGVTRKPADLESILGPTPAQPALSAFSFPTGDSPVDVPPVPPPPGAVASDTSWPNPPSSPRGPAPLPAFGVPGAPVAPGPPGPPPPRPPFPGAGAPNRPPPPLPRPAPPITAFTGAPPDDDATTIGSPPAELVAESRNSSTDDTAEWPSVYEAYKSTKQQCGESIEGLTFEKFSQTLRKHRDALVAKHACKRVKFSVSVKDGKASLKAAPVKD